MGINIIHFNYYPVIIQNYINFHDLFTFRIPAEEYVDGEGYAGLLPPVGQHY